MSGTQATSFPNQDRPKHTPAEMFALNLGPVSTQQIKIVNRLSDFMRYELIFSLLTPYPYLLYH